METALVVKVTKDPKAHLSVPVHKNGQIHHWRKLPFYKIRIGGRIKAWGAGTSPKSAVKNMLKDFKIPFPIQIETPAH